MDAGAHPSHLKTPCHHHLCAPAHHLSLSVPRRLLCGFSPTPHSVGLPAAGAMDEGALESSSEEGSSLDEPSWVSWFCMLRNHEFFCEVDPAFVQDRFNLYGLKEVVGPLYGEAMTMILGYAPTGVLPGQACIAGAISLCVCWDRASTAWCG